jgi:1-acyl-sn-glycerol-3-phosphate acyltransferase
MPPRRPPPRSASEARRQGPHDLAAPVSATTDVGARAGALLRAWRWSRLALHVVHGALTIVLVHPFTARATHQSLRQRWSLRLLQVLGLRLEARGEAVAPGCMLVANHISWVDIFVINALAPAAFVSKAEVRAWPVIGWLAAKNDTIFLRRGSRGHARIINAETAALLDAGCNVAIFRKAPPPTAATCRISTRHLLQPAIDAGAPIQPHSPRLPPAGWPQYTRAAGLRRGSEPAATSIAGNHCRTANRRPRFASATPLADG